MKPRILAIEDNPADVDLLRRALRHAQLDCDLTVFDDGEEGLKYVRNNGSGDALPDLAVLDLNLPKHGGFEILEAMHESGFRRIPVLVMSSSSNPRDRERLSKFPGVRFVTKPLDLLEFFGIGYIVKELLEQSRGAAPGSD